MNDRSATTTKDTLFRATSIQPATLIRTFAVGLHQGQRTWFPRKQAGHMTASRQPVQNVEKETLANQGCPHALLYYLAGFAGQRDRTDDPRSWGDRERLALDHGHGLSRRRMPRANRKYPRQLHEAQ